MSKNNLYGQEHLGYDLFRGEGPSIDDKHVSVSKYVLSTKTFQIIKIQQLIVNSSQFYNYNDNYLNHRDNHDNNDDDNDYNDYKDYND